MNYISSSSTAASRIETVGFYFFLATVFLTPLVFIPNPYVSLALVKTMVIALGIIVSALCYGYASYKERSFVFPPAQLLWPTLLLILSLAASSLASGAISKSFFGQGFEVGTASLLLMFCLSIVVAYTALHRNKDRVIVLYASMTVSFLIVLLFLIIRLVAGPDVMAFSIFTSIVSTMIGTWFELGIYALFIAAISISAVVFLPLSRKVKVFYWFLVVLSGLCALMVNNNRAWIIFAAVMLGLAGCVYVYRSRAGEASRRKKISVIALSACIIAIVLAVWGGRIVTPSIVRALNISYSEISLSWQSTLDIAVDSAKDQPMLGIGPNRFTQAFLAHKPSVINMTNAWGVEFGSGTNFILTQAVSQGLVGSVVWLIFFISLGYLIVRAVRGVEDDSYARFMVVSSALGTVFLWLTAFMYAPSHVVLFYTFVMTGIFGACAVKYGNVRSREITFSDGPRSRIIRMIISILLLAVLVVWGLMYVKKTVALSYFGAGVRQLTVAGNVADADRDFRRALTYDKSDIYWRAAVETRLAEIRVLVSNLPAVANASTTAIANQVGVKMNEAVSYANSAIALDPTNYYNYISKARVFESAVGLGIPDGYTNGLQAYAEAIRLNPSNPGIHLSVARLHASQKKFDEALTSIGSALQLKSNYLDAVYLLSQVQAANGNLSDAITAARVGTEINPREPVLFFQLGLLHYTDKSYREAVDAFLKAIALNDQYANAHYFLGLSYARLNKIGDAIAEFEKLAVSNPNNEDVLTILSNLRAGRPVFSGSDPAPEKRSALPVDER